MAWHWEQIGEALLAKPLTFVGMLNQRMKALENHLFAATKAHTQHARVVTTDATTTTLFTISAPLNATFLVTGYVVARRTGGSAGTANDGAGYRVKMLVKNEAGTVAVIGDPATFITVIGESQAGWTAEPSAPGGSLVGVRVTGAVDNNVTWVWTGQVISVDDRT